MTNSSGFAGRRLTGALLAVASLLLGACGDKGELYLDLIAEKDLARCLPAALMLNAEQLQASGSGWWAVERPSDATAFVWARSESVNLDLEVAGGADLELAFRCWPFSWEGAPTQSVTVELNGRAAGSVVLEGGKANYTVDLPEDLVIRGSNHLELQFAHVARPVDHHPDSEDRRSLAAAFEWLRIASVGVGQPTPGHSEPADEGLTIAVGDAAVYSARLGEGWTLALQAVAQDGPAQALVWLRSPGQEEVVILSESLNGGERGRWKLDLGPFSGRTVEIGLTTVVSDTGGGDGGSVRWLKGQVSGPPETLNQPPNVVLIAVDTLRADFLSAYGGPAKSPNIDRLASAGVRFQWAYSHIPITGPSHSSIFTSLLPTEHGVHNNSQVLASEHTTLAETLQTAGYTTAAFVSLGVLNGRFGFEQGFDHYDDRFDGDWMKNADEINTAVVPWLDEHGNDPFFLWVHYSDPHEPYTPPNRSYPGVKVFVGDTEVGRVEANGRSSELPVELAPGTNIVRLVAEDPEADVAYRFPYINVVKSDEELRFVDGWSTKEKRFGNPAHDSALPATIEIDHAGAEPLLTSLQLTCKERLGVAQIRERYVDEIEYLDGVLGQLLTSLDERGLTDNSLIIFLADHGEGLGDHNHVGHISQVYDTLIRVPLSLTFPGHIREGAVVEQRVGLVDLYPTVLDVIGLPAPDNLGGRSLLPLLRSRGADRPVVAVTFKPEAASDKRAIILGGYKYIHSESDHEWEELYDLGSDPNESIDLKESHPDQLEWLRGELESLLSRSTAVEGAAQADLSDEDRARLRELGYIH